MKRLLLVAVVALYIFTGSAVGQDGPAPAGIKLLPPKASGRVSVVEALHARKSDRTLSPQPLSLQHLSEILWAANGVNRENGKRTAPSPRALQFMDVYAVLANGVYLYNPLDSTLTLIAAGDFRKDAGMQDFVYSAPLNLVYVFDPAKLKDVKGVPGEDEQKLWAGMQAGFYSENVNLYCASENIGAVVRTGFDKRAFAKKIGLRPDQLVISAQTIGYVAK